MSGLLKPTKIKKIASINDIGALVYLNLHFKDILKRIYENDLYCRLTTLPQDAQKELVEHILNSESHMFGLNIRDVRRLAFYIYRDLTRIQSYLERFNLFLIRNPFCPTT